MRRRDFLKCVAVALCVSYLPPTSKTENVSIQALLDRVICQAVRDGEWEVLHRNFGCITGASP